MFKTMTNITKPGNIPSDSDIAKIPSFIMCNWMSGSPRMVHMANTFNQFSDIPIKNQFLTAKFEFQGKVNYVPYPKKIKDEMSKNELIIQEMLQLSNEKSKLYASLISDEEMNELSETYKELQEIKSQKVKK